MPIFWVMWFISELFLKDILKRQIYIIPLSMMLKSLDITRDAFLPENANVIAQREEMKFGSDEA